MQQVATFLVPQQQAECNEFLRTHKSDNTSFNKDTVIIFYDNGETSPEYEVAGLREFLTAIKDAKFQQEHSLFVMERKLADVQEERSRTKSSSNKGRAEELDQMIAAFTSGISATKQAIAEQDIKAEFVQGKIDALKA